MESNTLIEQLKAMANEEGCVTIKFQYPNGWEGPQSFKNGEVREMHYDLAAIFVSKGIASTDLEAKEGSADTPEQSEAEPTETKSTNKKTTKKK